MPVMWYKVNAQSLGLYGNIYILLRGNEPFRMS